MRLDKFLADTGRFTRREAGETIRRGWVTVNGNVEKSPAFQVAESSDRIAVEGEEIAYQAFVYLMMNKPPDTVSTTEDDPKSVMKLLPPSYSRIGLFPCGRLDIDTVGLLLLTNDGQTAHRLLSPKKHCEKTYRFTCLPLDGEAVHCLEEGVVLSDFKSKPCRVEMTGPAEGRITVTEGKYHQIKRMFQTVGSGILTLERTAFAGLTLDPALGRGEWRPLTEEEVEIIKRSQV